MAQAKALERNGWQLYAHPAFQQRFGALTDQVERLVEQHPHSFQEHPAYKLWDSIVEALEERVPRDPNSKDFLCATLGPGGRWRRVKKGLPQRYRLFFQFRSEHPRRILYVWFNDDTTLRKAGDRNDVYMVFKAMLKKGQFPSTFDQLLSQCHPLCERRAG